MRYLITGILFCFGVLLEFIAFNFSFKQEVIDRFFIVWLFLHIGASFFIALSFYILYLPLGKRKAVNWAIYSFFITVSVPLWGFLGSLSVGLIYYIIGRQPDNTYEEYKDFVSHENIKLIPEKELEHRDLIIQDKLAIEPIVDILDSDDLDLKITAVDRLKEAGNFDSVNLLKKNLSSDNHEVRFHSYVALCSMEDSFQKKIETLFACLFENRTKNNVKKLSDTFVEYAGSGLLDDARAGFILELAVKEYTSLLSETLDDKDDIYYNLALITMIKKEYKKAMEYLEKITKEFKYYNDVLACKIECYYSFSDYNKIFSLLDNELKHKGKEDFQDSKRYELLEFWKLGQN